MTVGCDIDGVITVLGGRNKLKLPWWMFLFLAFVPLAKEMRKALVSLSVNHKIVFISSRPKRLDYLTQRWLIKKRVPYSSLFLVGLEPGIKERKLDVIMQERIDLFIDDEEEIISFLRERGINAISPKGAFYGALFY